MNSNRGRLTFIGLLLLLGLRGQAAIIYSQPYDFVAEGGGFGSFRSDFTYSLQAADKFQMGMSTNVSAIRWWGYYQPGIEGSVPPASDNFTIRFYSQTGPGNTPATTPFVSQTGLTVSRTLVGTIVFGMKLFQFEANLTSPVSLLGSTPYSLSIVSTTQSPDNWNWVGATTAPDAIFYRRATDADLWIENPSFRSMSFELSDTPLVPEPSQLAIFATGIGFLGRRWRRITVRN